METFAPEGNKIPVSPVIHCAKVQPTLDPQPVIRWVTVEEAQRKGEVCAKGPDRVPAATSLARGKAILVAPMRPTGSCSTS